MTLRIVSLRRAPVYQYLVLPVAVYVPRTEDHGVSIGIVALESLPPHAKVGHEAGHEQRQGDNRHRPVHDAEREYIPVSGKEEAEQEPADRREDYQGYVGYVQQ